MNGEPAFGSLTETARNAVEAAAATLLGMIREKTAIEVTVKPDNTLVLNVDLALQKTILKVLKPTGVLIVSEELPDTHRYIGTKETYFVVDPVDGTTSCKRFFAHRDTQVGFGPMVGVVVDGTLHAVAFYNCPARKLYVAEKGKGAWVKKEDSHFQKLQTVCPPTLEECGLLFYGGINGELAAIEKIKRKDLVENMYRFGGFANDCSRIAEGYEQIQLQYTVQAWDIPASLLIVEAGEHDVFIKDKNFWTPLYERLLTKENPMIACPKKFSALLLQALNDTIN